MSTGPIDTHVRRERERELRAQLLDALHCGDVTGARVAYRKLDDLYVAASYRRMADPEVVRLRRQIRESAA